VDSTRKGPLHGKSTSNRHVMLLNTTLRPLASTLCCAVLCRAMLCHAVPYCAVCCGRYQGVDWSHPSALGCNRAWDPSGPGDTAHDGTALDPMEVRQHGSTAANTQPGAVPKAQHSTARHGHGKIMIIQCVVACVSRFSASPGRSGSTGGAGLLRPGVAGLISSQACCRSRSLTCPWNHSLES